MAVRETEADTEVFDTAHDIPNLPWIGDPAEVWGSGPWIAYSPQDGGSTLSGPYYPLLIRIEGPYDAIAFMEAGGAYESHVTLTLREGTTELGTSTHGVVAVDGQHYSSGDEPAPGVFVAVGAHREWTTAKGEVLGAGHVAKGQFQFTSLEYGLQANTLEGCPKVTWDQKKAERLHGSGPAIFDILKTVANSRREARFGAAPGATYNPGYITRPDGILVPGHEDPGQVFANYLWENWVIKNGNGVVRDPPLVMTTLADREKAWSSMIVNNPNGWFGPLSSLTANDIFAKAMGKNFPPVPALWKCPGSEVPVLGSCKLVGEWKSWAEDGPEQDWPCNSQNSSQILHFNQGMRWEKLVKPSPVDGQKAILDSLYHFLVDPGLQDDVRKQGIVLNLLAAGYAPESLKKYPGGVGAVKLLVAGSATKGAEIYDKYIRDTKEWKELVDEMVCAKAFTTNGKPDPLSVYICYEIASGEGFHVFGHDSFNDIIATEGGRLFATELCAEPSAITTQLAVVPQMEVKLGASRDAFLQHPVWAKKEPRQTAENAFYSMFLAVNRNGTVAATVKNSGFHGAGTDVWRRTFWTILISVPFDDQYRKDAQGLLQDLQTHLEDVSKRKTAFRRTRVVLESLFILKPFLLARAGRACFTGGCGTKAPHAESGECLAGGVGDRLWGGSVSAGA